MPEIVIREAVRRHWNEAAGYQKILYLTGALLVLSGLFHALVLLITGGPVEGNVSFRKAATFGEAFGLTACSLAWILTFLPRRQALWGTLGILYSVATLVEVFLVTLQVWRGVPSHFNASTPFDNAVFALMGISIVLHFPLMIALLVACWTSLRAAPEFRWVIRAGMLLLMLSQALGGMMIAAGGNVVGQAGSGKLPHALGLHALQVLPALALLLQLTRWRQPVRTAVAQAGVAGYVGLTAVTTIHSLMGRAPADLGAAETVALAAGAILLAGSFLWALRGLNGSSA